VQRRLDDLHRRLQDQRLSVGRWVPAGPVVPVLAVLVSMTPSSVSSSSGVRVRIQNWHKAVRLTPPVRLVSLGGLNQSGPVADLATATPV
jgi:hypothetical protein